MKRMVAIVGRPNVGKSSLFNRLARRRIAIVHEESGVTRDRLLCETAWKGENFQLMDTGGIGYFDGATPEDEINKGIVDQAKLAIEDATVLILVMDAQAGLLPLDQEVAQILHHQGLPVFVAVNKADNEALALASSEFETLGFPVFYISALHNRGLDPLLKEVVKFLPREENTTKKNPLKVAVVGRPNAGKSSYINRLLRNDRIIVSEQPGTTRDAIEVFFQVGQGNNARHYLLMDTAGIKKSGSIRDSVERFSMMRTERSIERSDVTVLLLDAEQGPRVRDKKLAAMILNKKKGCIMLVNKWDLVQNQTTQRRYGAAINKALPFLNFVPVIFASAKSGYNIRKSIEAIDHVAAQISTEITTGILNRVLQNAYQRNPPPKVKNQRLKIFYATQIGVRPIRFQFFVNNPACMTLTYRAYLINTLRKHFGFEGAPVLLFCKAR